MAVRSSDELQRALNNARPGDTIQLARGVEYVGNFILPATPAGDSRPITLRTYSDWGLPGNGQRMRPAYAVNLASIRSPNGEPALRTAAGAHHWRILLLEFRGNAGGQGDVIALGAGDRSQATLESVPHDLVVERVYVHGDVAVGQKRGIALNAAAVDIRDSWIAEIKAIGQDSQAIAGWNGPGGYTIQNNFLEAAGENVMFGGADPSILGLTPTGIRVVGNTLSKPTAWRDMPARWQVKNLLELKNARDVLIEGNLLERSWQQAQTGYAVLLTVRNQDGGCPWCQVEAVTFRRNVVREVAAGLQIIGADPEYATRPMREIAVLGNLFDGIDRSAYGGDGYVALIGGSPSGVRIDHNTFIQRASGGVLKLADGATAEFSFTNNIASHGDYGIIGTDHGIGDDSIRTYLPGARIEQNVLAGGPSGRYPPGNFFPSLEEFARHFQAYGGGNYRLVLSSPWRRRGSDGKDLGADISALPR